MSDFLARKVSQFASQETARRMNPLALYEPLPFQQAYHACMARECLLRKGVRAGGSLAGIIEDVRALLGCDPYNKYPKTNGTLVMVGFGERHIGQVFHRQMLEPGLFKLIRDEQTGQWRAFRPWQEYDAAYEEKAIDAPPLLRKGKDCKVVYESRGKHIFQAIHVPSTGWRALAYNSAGDPGQCQGFSVHLAHIDEDVDNPGWKDELSSRCSGVGGLLRWTARVHDRTPDIQAMADTAAAEEKLPKPTTVLIQATILDNPHWKKDKVDEFIRICKAKGDDVYRSHVLGLPTLDHVRVYERFNSDDHGMDPRKLPGNGPPEHRRIPDNWCRIVGLDPGILPASALFVAIPPPGAKDSNDEPFGDICLVYDELQVQDSDAEKFAFAIKQKAGDDVFWKFIIDDHGSRSREMGSGVPVVDQYFRKFKQYDLRSELTGHGFEAGSDAVESRISEVRNWLANWPDGMQLRFLRGRVPQFEKEMLAYKKTQVKLQNGKKHTIDKPNTRGIHLPVILEYIAASGPYYSAPRGRVKKKSFARTRLDAKRSRDKNRNAVFL